MSLKDNNILIKEDSNRILMRNSNTYKNTVFDSSAVTINKQESIYKNTIKDNKHSMLKWINFTVKSKKTDKYILNNISGEVSSKETLAIIGGSGAGKTTLLNYLSRRNSKSGLVKTSGELKLITDEVDVTNYFNEQNSFVTQDDILLEYLTPFELLKFSADLKLDDSNNKEVIVNELLDKLGLNYCKDTLVGSVENKGLSGGERKRTSIGYELITNPKILFLDEPTTGLDIITASNIIECISNEAKYSNRIIIYTIHQPSSDIFKKFDKLMVMANGRSVYNGLAKDAVKFYEKFNFKCHNLMNPAEFLISAVTKQNYYLYQKNESKKNSKEVSNKSLVSLENNRLANKIESDNNFNYDTDILVGNDKGFDSLLDISLNVDLEDFEEINSEKYNNIDEKYNKLIEDMANNNNIIENKEIIIASDDTNINYKPYRISIYKEFLILLKRNFLAQKRDKSKWFTRLMMTLGNAIFVILSFSFLGTGNSAVRDREAALFYITNIVVSVNMQINLVILIKERINFYQETDSNLYNTGPYLLSKVVLEIPTQIIFSIVLSIIVYFFCAFNLNFAYKYFLFILICVLSGTAAAFFSYFISNLVNKIEAAPAILPFFILTQSMTGGYIIKVEDIPVYFKFFYYISIYRYTYQSFLYNEFTDEIDLDCHDPEMCKDPLSNIENSFAMNMTVLIIISCVLLVLTYLLVVVKKALRQKANKE